MNSNKITRQLLLWLAVTPGSPSPDSFLKNPASEIDGHQVSADELHEAVKSLVARELITGLGTWQDGLLRVFLTNEGKLCVEDYGADVDAWRSAQRPYTDQSVTVNSGDNTQITAHSKNTSQTQTITINTSNLEDAATHVEGHLEDYRAAGVDADELKEITSQIKSEAATDVPDDAKLQKLGRRLAGQITPTAGLVTVTKFVLDMLGVTA